MRMIPYFPSIKLCNNHWMQVIFYLAVAIISVSFLCLLLLSTKFDYSIHWQNRPTYVGIILMMSAAIGYLLLLWAVSKAPTKKYLILTLIVFGGFLRLIWLWSTPIYEDDFYRYFFDGAMSANTINPYLHAPADALPSILPSHINEDIEPHKNQNQIVIKLKEITENKPIDRVAYPYIRTIYPPISQMFFALNHSIEPWSLKSWRLILFLVDCISLFLLFKLLQAHKKSEWLAMVFWLNPLIITETMNAGHMDALLLPFLIGATLLMHKNKHSYAGALLAGAVGVKLWPAILAPIIFGRFLKKPKKLVLTALPFIILTALLLAPQILARLDTTSGVVAYAENWNINAFAFTLIDQVIALISDESSLHARIMIVLIITLILLWYLRNRTSQASEPAKYLLIITTTLFLLSPTGYPWYFIWLMPWLVLYPHPALLLLTFTLPLYDLRYPLSLNEEGDIFNAIIVPIEFGPTIFWLFKDCIQKWMKGKST